MRIEIPLYDGFDELDAIAPFEVLTNAARADASLDVRLVALGGPREILASHGARIHASHALSDDPDLVIVPGGGWAAGRTDTGVRAEIARGDLPDALARLHARGATIASVCTGAMLLSAAGLLEGRPATTHHSAAKELQNEGAELVRARVVDDGDVLTAGGVTSGLDLALHLAERELGPRVALAIERGLEYERRGTVFDARRSR